MAKKEMFLDTETTGVLPWKHGIIQIAGRIFVDDEEVESFDIKMRPHPDREVDDRALKANNTTLAEINKYQDSMDGKREFSSLLSAYIDKFNTKDKFLLYAYNGHFDTEFLRSWFTCHGDKYFGSFFFTPTLDVMQLVAWKLREHRHELVDFKLGTVTEYLKVDMDKSKLHEALYDVDTMMQIYRLLTNNNQ